MPLFSFFSNLNVHVAISIVIGPTYIGYWQYECMDIDNMNSWSTRLNLFSPLSRGSTQINNKRKILSSSWMLEIMKRFQRWGVEYLFEILSDHWGEVTSSNGPGFGSNQTEPLSHCLKVNKFQIIKWFGLVLMINKRFGFCSVWFWN